MDFDFTVDEPYEDDSSIMRSFNHRYAKNKASSVGSFIVCPSCGFTFRKKSYQQAFDKKSCKDRYWNTVSPERKARAMFFRH